MCLDVGAADEDVAVLVVVADTFVAGCGCVLGTLLDVVPELVAAGAAGVVVRLATLGELVVGV